MKKVKHLWLWFACQAGYWFISFLLLGFLQDERWFSHLMASIFCQAVAAILYQLEPSKQKRTERLLTLATKHCPVEHNDWHEILLLARDIKKRG